MSFLKDYLDDVQISKFDILLEEFRNFLMVFRKSPGYCLDFRRTLDVVFGFSNTPGASGYRLSVPT